MPEEINRLVTDAVTNWFFTTSEHANENLRRSGVGEDRIFFVGNTMIANLLRQMPNLKPAGSWDEMGLEGERYFVLTLHRPANVDEKHKLSELLSAVGSGTRGCPIVFPVHPRTRKALEDGCDLPESLHCVEPMSYLEFNHLVKNAYAVITDSGGITEEATVMGVPCMTLRDNTERPETIELGTNELVGTDPAALKPYLDRLFAGGWKAGTVPPLWDEKVAVRIVAHLEGLLTEPDCPRRRRGGKGGGRGY
jgi:UDP-N-acetylglucosamine 2-epimerase (non-hydrolysing)